MNERSPLIELLRSRLLLRPGRDGTVPSALRQRPEIARLELAKGDLDQLLRVANASSDYIDCIVRLLDLSAIKLDWDDGQPQLHSESVAAWLCLLDDFEPDLLLCAHLYRWLSDRCGCGDDGGLAAMPGRRDLDRWDTHVGFADADLRNLLSRGMADMHVHLGGIRQPADVWRRVCRQSLSITDIAITPDDRTIRPPALPLRLGDEAEWAVRFRRKHVSPRAGETPLAFMRCERRCYLRLLHIVKIRSKSVQAGQALRYFWFKHQLWRAMRQPQSGAAPGLHEFSSVWFRAVPRDLGMRAPARRWRSTSAVAREHEDPLSMLLGQRELRRMELRMSPFARAVDYARFVSGWEHMERQLARHIGSLPQIAFAVHLQRNPRSATTTPIQMLDKFDAETATLQLFRHTRPEPSRRFVRIDLAAVERDGPARLAGPFFRLLRGDSEMLSWLAQEEKVSPGRLTRWRELKRRGLAHSGLNGLKLGASCHSGEDFGALLLGLKEIADAIDSMALGVGDSIGHGLALGWDPQLFEQRSGWSTLVPAGDVLDALIWARLELEAECPSDLDRRWLGKIDTLIDTRLRVLCGQGFDAVPQNLASLRQYRKSCLVFPFTPLATENSPFQAFVASRFDDPDVARRFAMMEPWAQCDERTLPHTLLESLQRRLRQRCADRGIAIELHPSSNIRITGLGSLQHCPTMALLTAEERFARVIGTDDPGVFATTIAMEYGLAFSELQQRNLSREEALQVLERSRLDGLESIRWPAALRSQQRASTD